MSQEHAHFLGAIADKNWLAQPGSSILISLGPVARAGVAAAYERLRQQPTATAIDLAEEELQDFSVRQVTVDLMDQLSGGVVGRFEKEAKKSATGPILLPGDKMRHVLLLTDEYDELRHTQLAITPAGTLAISVVLEDFYDGRAFAVTGGIDLAALAAEYAG